MFALLPELSTAEPSRGYTQELAHAAQPGRIYLDLYNTTGTHIANAPNQLRIGLPPAELIISEHDIGFKTMVYRNIAAYTQADASLVSNHVNLHIGAAIAWHWDFLMFNFNPEIVRTDGVNNIILNGALLMPLDWDGGYGKFQFGLEASLLDNRNAHTALALGMRWLPTPPLTLDIVFIGDSGQAGRTFEVATPAALRINLRLM